jgi:hypothetical protein
MAGKGKIGRKKKSPGSGLGVGVGAGSKKKDDKKKESIIDKINPVNPNKTGWMKEQVKKRTEVTPLPKKKK